MTEKKQASLTTRIVTGMVAGILVGTILQWLMPDGSDAVIPLYLFDLSLRGFLVDGVFEVGGQVFISSYKC